MATPLVRLIRRAGGTDTVVATSQGGALIASWLAVDEPTAGTYTYVLQVAGQLDSTGPTGDAGVIASTLLALVIRR